ncbi:MAG: hypothetical protein GY862_33870 [Gammaproteobacteria bacterium]|nr:hypothetical protein [Gammaproteobacteria bacterium]
MTRIESLHHMDLRERQEDGGEENFSGNSVLRIRRYNRSKKLSWQAHAEME